MTVLIKDKTYDSLWIGFSFKDRTDSWITAPAGSSLSSIASLILSTTGITFNYKEIPFASFTGKEISSIFVASDAGIEFLSDFGFSGGVHNGIKRVCPTADQIGHSRLVLYEPDLTGIFFSYQKANYFKTSGVVHWNGMVSRKRNYDIPLAYSLVIEGISDELIRGISETLDLIGNDQEWKLTGSSTDGFPFPETSTTFQVVALDELPSHEADSGEYSITVIISEVI